MANKSEVDMDEEEMLTKLIKQTRTPFTWVIETILNFWRNR